VETMVGAAGIEPATLSLEGDAIGHQKTIFWTFSVTEDWLREQYRCRLQERGQQWNTGNGKRGSVGRVA
jgi:hypothetical protein